MNEFTVNTQTVDGPVEAVFPANGEQLPYYNNFVFSWEPVDGADHYVLEYSTNPIFAGDVKTFIKYNTTGHWFGGDDLNPNQTIYWKLTPFNYYSTCASTSQGNFKTGNATSTKEDELSTSWSIAPNPIQAAAASELLVRLEGLTGVALFRVLDVNGKVQFSSQMELSQGQSNTAIDISSLSKGVYFVNLTIDEKQSIKKLIVQ